jgi:hypothetical protein
VNACHAGASCGARCSLKINNDTDTVASLLFFSFFAASARMDVHVLFVVGTDTFFVIKKKDYLMRDLTWRKK